MITVAIIEDHQILVDALNLMLRSSAEFPFVGAAACMAEGLELVRHTMPDVLLLDLALPDGNGFDLVPQVMEASPATRVVVLTSYADEDSVMRAVNLGVNAFLPKGCSLTELLDTIRRAAAGEIVMPAQLLVNLLRRTAYNKAIEVHEETFRERLTPREYEILRYLAMGMSGNAIAEELKITPLTVRTHIRNLMSKLGVHSRLEAVVYGARHGLVDLRQ